MPRSIYFGHVVSWLFVGIVLSLGRRVGAIPFPDATLLRWFEATDIAPFGFPVVDFMPMSSSGYSLCGPRWRLRTDLDVWRKLNGPPTRISSLTRQSRMPRSPP